MASTLKMVEMGTENEETEAITSIRAANNGKWDVDTRRNIEPRLVDIVYITAFF